MPSSYLSLHYHLVFSTKHKAPAITSDIAPRLYEYFGGILRSKQGQVLIANGMPNHVHLLVRLGATHAVSDILRTIKASSSGWIHDTFPSARDFTWQTGYGAFSVSRSNLDSVQRYIEQQQNHHQQQSYEGEFRAFLMKHEVEFDEKYLWD